MNWHKCVLLIFQIDLNDSNIQQTFQDILCIHVVQYQYSWYNILGKSPLFIHVHWNFTKREAVEQEQCGGGTIVGCSFLSLTKVLFQGWNASYSNHSGHQPLTPDCPLRRTRSYTVVPTANDANYCLWSQPNRKYPGLCQSPLHRALHLKVNRSLDWGAILHNNVHFVLNCIMCCLCFIHIKTARS